MELQSFVDALSSFGWPGLLAALVILAGVFVARKSGVVATGNHARLANLVLGAILYGLNGNADSEAALHSILASLLAGLAFKGIEYLSDKASNKSG